MGRKCCVPGCTSNYRNEDYTSVFKFPSAPERRQQWIKSINRANFEPSSTAVVCVKHFEERFIIREDKAVRDDGTLLVVQRKKLNLTPDAFPTKFPNQPSYLTKMLPIERKSPAVRQQQIISRDEEKFAQWCAEDEISCFENFIDKCPDKLTGNWLFRQRDTFAGFYRVEDNGCPKLAVSFKVFKDLTVNIWFENAALDMKSFRWLLGANLICDKWTKFDSLVSHLSSYEDHSSMTFDQNLLCAIKCLESSVCENEEVNMKINFLKQQLLLLSQKVLRYATDTLLWCAKLYFTYPAAYNLIRSTKVMTLPHQCYLKKLSSFCNSIYTDNTHFQYLKEKANLLEEHEKIVNLLLDEIYVKPMITYKAGCLIGTSENSNSEASTILAFMLSSVLSKNKDVIALFPVRNLTADDLLKLTKQVLEIVYNCNFTVLAMISDNNRINRNMFTSLCGSELKPWIPHPLCPEKKLFFMFDSVHLIKAIRNNWLNQTMTNQVLYFPSPTGDKLCCANLMDLKLIYDNERHSVIKLAPKLSQKVLYPNNIERQNVNNALHLFHETNCVALQISKEKLTKDAMDTKLFLEYISKWWKIMNIKHPFTGQHSLDDMLHPIKSLDDKNFVFLQEFSSWLQRWNALSILKADEKKAHGIPGRGGMLSKETFSAMQLTMQSTIEIVKYMFETLGFSYVLLGKFQTDNLEARFGQYRQMSGGNYNVSCQQIYESEKKLRILSLISLHSESKGKFQLKYLDFDCQDLSTCDIPEHFYEVFNSYSDIDVSEDTMSVLLYLSGYVANKVCNKLNCNLCTSLLVKDKTLVLECSKDIYNYLKLTDKGALKWPQELMILVTVNAFQIFEKLISDAFESDFLRHPKQKALLCQLTLEKLQLLEVVLSEKCSCGAVFSSIIKKCLSGLANIFHNNYAKLRNDDHSSKGNKRKMSTLRNF